MPEPGEPLRASTRRASCCISTSRHAGQRDRSRWPASCHVDMQQLARSRIAEYSRSVCIDDATSTCLRRGPLIRNRRSAIDRCRLPPIERSPTFCLLSASASSRRSMTDRPASALPAIPSQIHGRSALSERFGIRQPAWTRPYRPRAPNGREAERLHPHTCFAGWAYCGAIIRRAPWIWSASALSLAGSPSTIGSDHTAASAAKRPSSGYSRS